MSTPPYSLSLAERHPIAVRAAVAALVVAVIHVLVALGVPVPEDLEDSILDLVDAGAALLVVISAIRAVTPNAKVITQVTTEGTVVAGEAAIEPTGAEVETLPSNETGLPVPLATVNPDLVAPDTGRAA